ncbi:hypothetical protein CCR75_006290 [Bremia lactucae]|uniref:Mucin-like protein n=1 Tax=Bremia lactucae TaxID=4779 RepID=A0A976FQ38_BRELC|nr:hypothetical protein CCR75_006290 [Bremia lactucae]
MAACAASTSATEISVCRDATYNISVDAASLCAGTGAAPAGWRCPKAGEVAVADCVSTLATYTSDHCVTYEDAVCQVIHNNTWGCVLPSVGCNVNAPREVESVCKTWDYSDNDLIDSSTLFNTKEKYNTSWFMPLTKVRPLYECGRTPTPAPSTTLFEASSIVSTTTTTTEQLATTSTLNSTNTSSNTLADVSQSEALPTKSSFECRGFACNFSDAKGPGNGKITEKETKQIVKSLTSVALAATIAESKGRRNKVMAFVAAAVAFVAVVVAAVALVYVRQKLVGEKTKVVEDTIENASQEEDEGSDQDAKLDGPSIAPPTPTVVAGRMAKTPIAAMKATVAGTIIAAERSFENNSGMEPFSEV